MPPYTDPEKIDFNYDVRKVDCFLVFDTVTSTASGMAYTVQDARKFAASSKMVNFLEKCFRAGIFERMHLREEAEQLYREATKGK